ncbi:nucleolin-like [Antechinus flavipes]|uniref:nucleolin-like n=1 Tax=Antechinus flavipes TaxID=38775 RepID=UPI0022366B79|nr:nucleolin-like [Antechinus flavipes]XP_051824313.1 nucleolin-like [Antechinus flavipes]XP_051824314.1 nucleolin-like [Antechinus flavipes]XP_051824315.1 nucleolin-like [Antechinus flavipes]XP_051824316.1 nucleolin-like [Antechinus flavipes]
MAERWSGFGDSDSDQEVAAARNRQWEELWGTEENDWGEEEDEDEDEEPEDREDEDEEPEREDEDEDEDDEWQSVVEGNWEDEEEEEDEDWEDEEQQQVKLEEKPERMEVEHHPQEVKEEQEDEEEDSQLSLEALRVLDRLKIMNCPFLKGLYKSKLKTAKQFLCTPSNYRLDILAWLFARLYPPFQESFETWQDSNAEEKIIDLTRLGHKLKLCGPDDHDLIKGCAQGKRQLGFMHEAINRIESLSSEFSDKPARPRRAKTKVEELSEKLSKLTEMLQAHKEEVLCRQESTSRLFSPSPPGLPKQDKKAVTEDVATSLNVEQKKACMSGGDCMMALGKQSLLPKPATTQTPQLGVPSLESELGASP